MQVFSTEPFTLLGGRGHRRALARQAGAELPKVKDSRATKSRAKPGFLLPPGSSAVGSHSAQPCPALRCCGLD